MIGTHNSGTGERAGSFLSKVLRPFCKCQTKTLIEQYDAGCRYFDIRVRLGKDGEWYLCHGLWVSKYRAWDLIKGLYLHTKDNVFMSITYEGVIPEDLESRFIDFSLVINSLPYIHVDSINVKLPDWRVLKNLRDLDIRYGFIPLNKYTWKRFIPIPRFWSWFVTPDTTDSFSYTMVDFL